MPEGLTYRLGRLERAAEENGKALRELGGQVAILVYERQKEKDRSRWIPPLIVGLLAAAPGYVALFIHHT